MDQPGTSEEGWETCEVGHEASFLSARFVARVVGPQGVERIYDPERARIAVDNLARPVRSDEAAVQSHQRLVSALVEDGWEPAGRKQPLVGGSVPQTISYGLSLNGG